MRRFLTALAVSVTSWLLILTLSGGDIDLLAFLLMPIEFVATAMLPITLSQWLFTRGASQGREGAVNTDARDLLFWLAATWSIYLNVLYAASGSISPRGGGREYFLMVIAVPLFALLTGYLAYGRRNLGDDQRP